MCIRDSVGPVGVEALEDALQRVRLDARALILDRDEHVVGDAREHDLHRLVSRREGARVVDQVDQDLADAGIVAEHEELTLIHI